MGILSTISKLKLPDAQKVQNIPKNLKQNTKNNELNTVDVLYFSHDWSNCFLIQGIKSRIGKRPNINIESPEKLSTLESDYSSSFNISTKRNMYIMNERSPYTVCLRNIPLQSSIIRLNPSHDENPNDEALDIDLTQKMLSTLATVKFTDEMNEKDNSGHVVVFIMGALVGMVVMTLLYGFLFGN